jgi:ligand-binding sensor domain-containing protein
MSDSLWADDDDTLIILPGDRPKPRPRARAKAKTQFKRTLLPPIYGPPKEWRSYRSTSRINVAVRQGRVLWAGTQGSGLIQWDMRTGAYRFFVPQIERLDARTVNSLAPDKKGNLWIATNGYGVALLRRGRSKWKFYRRKHGLPGDTVNAVMVAKNGDVWVGTTRGVARFRRGRWRKFTVRNGLPSSDIQAVGQDSSGRIWFSSSIATPFYLRGRRFVKLKPFPVVGSTCIVSDRKGGLWFCNDQGVVHYNGSRSKLYTVSHGLAGPVVQSIYVDVSGGVWMGTKRRGISYFRNGQWVTMGRAHGLPGLNIKGIVGASGGRLFAATFLNGAIQYNKNRWSRLPIGIVGNRINTVAYAPDGAIWVGTASGCSRYYQRYWYNYTSFLPNFDVRSFAFEPSGTVWIGTYGGGVVRFDGRKYKTYDITSGLTSNKVVGSGLTPEGIWFLHPLKGLSLYNGKSWKSFTTDNQGAVLRATHPFKAFHIDPKMRLWAGTIGSGPVSRALNGRFKKFAKMTGASTRGIIHDIVVGKDDTYWFGTQHGLYRYRKGKLKRYTIRDGLPNNKVLAVALEGQKVWVGTPKGAAVFDGSSWRSFTRDMGLVSNHIATITVTPWGEKWFGSKYDGLTVYRGE